MESTGKEQRRVGGEGQKGEEERVEKAVAEVRIARRREATWRSSPSKPFHAPGEGLSGGLERKGSRIRNRFVTSERRCQFTDAELGRDLLCGARKASEKVQLNLVRRYLKPKRRRKQQSKEQGRAFPCCKKPSQNAPTTTRHLDRDCLVHSSRLLWPLDDRS
ncbi:hypothetical protein BHE74_00006254 [Ensete ventricosum]|nr:hypothetical protein GW17_00005956 [Ensete ventricosum]RWW85099.1 hypothetical protein BHE74_00006254 [Ensete ventricosum]